MKVSIIIPVYNVESYLVPCLQSVSQQSFTDFEVWLIDDGSKDRSAEICDSFVSQDPRFHVVHKQNAGVSTARNLGIEKSEGEWICFIDSDDTVEPHYLQNLYEEVNGHRDTLIMQGYTKLYTNGKKEPHCFEDETFGKGNMDVAFKERHLNRQGFMVGKLYNRSVLNQHGIRFNTKIHYAEDVMFMLTYLCHIDKVRTIKGANYNYFIRSKSGSLSQKINSFESEYTCYETYLTNMRIIAERFDIPESSLPFVYNVISEYLVRRSIGSLYQKSTAKPKEERIRILKSLAPEQILFLQKYYKECSWFHKVTVFLLSKHWYALCDWLNACIVKGRSIKNKF